MLRRYLVHYPSDEAAVRDAWPLQTLCQRRCEVWFNGRILTARALSGFGSWAHPDAYEFDADAQAPDHELGLGVNACLDRSWELTLRDLRAEIRQIDRNERQAQYRHWLSSFARRHGYKSERSLLRNMLHVHLVSRAGIMTLSPSNHDRMDGWSGEGIPPDSDVKLPADSPPEQIGVALRLALSRCLDSYGKTRR